MAMSVRLRLRDLPSIWSSLTPHEQKQLRESSPLVEAVLNPMCWMLKHTRTRDEQDKENPYKPFPIGQCFTIYTR